MAASSPGGARRSPDARTPRTLLRFLAPCVLVFLASPVPVRSIAREYASADSLPSARTWLLAGEYARTEPVARRAVAGLDSARAPAESLGAALDVLVESLWRQGFATRPETRRLAERALALRDTSGARLDSAAAGALLNLGAVRSQNGDDDGARLLVDRALAIRTRWPGPGSLDLAWALNERGSLALRTGDLETARTHLERVLAIRRRALGPWHPLVAWSCSNLASMFQASGDFIRARARFEECVRIRARSLPADHPDRARGLKDLANVLFALGDYGRARALYDESLRMRIRTLGEDHPEVANGLASQASRLQQIGDVPGALSSANRALVIRQRVFDPGNPEIASSLLQVGRILAESGRRAAAAESIGRAIAIRELSFGPEAPVTAIALDGLAQVLLVSGHADSACALARRAIAAKTAGLGAGHPDVARSWEVLAEALEAAGREEDAVSAALECERIARSHLVRTLARLSEREALQYEAVRTTGLDQAVRLASHASTSERTRRRVWDAVVRSRGRVLYEISARLRGTAAADAGLGDVLGRLPRGSALLSYVRCEGQRTPVPRPAEYVAFVTRAGGGGVVVRALGSASSLDSLVGRWRESVRSRASGAGRSRARAGAELRARIWDPLLPAIAGGQTVRVVPDGSLHGVNFYALPKAGGGYLVDEDREIELLGAERGLVRPRIAGRTTGRLVALGGIRYGPKPEGTGSYAALDRSGVEVREIAALWNRVVGDTTARRALVLSGGDATRANLRARAPSCEVLHIATHGVFAGEGIDPLGQLRPGPQAMTPPLSVLTRSGLVLAPEPSGSSAAEREGFFSAADATRLDLRGARWVVLSGCGTGSGRRLARAGVLGLRTAFEMAGTRVVIMSLWNVEDRWAEEWMRNLYRGRYGRGLTTGAAVREASRQMLESRRQLGLSDDPATWAAFVASGVED